MRQAPPLSRQSEAADAGLAQFVDQLDDVVRGKIMADKIRVLVVDDLRETRESVYKLLQFDGRVEVVGEAETGLEAIEKAKELRPDVILMDVNMPDMDGITATKTISQALPACQIIIMSVQSDTPYLRRAMLAGARDFLMKPFSLDELTRAVYEVYERRPVIPTAARPMAPASARQADTGIPPTTGGSQEGHVTAVFSPKGGSGCTTLAANLAVSLTQQGYRTILVDGNLQFGTISVMLNLKTTSTILDLVERLDELDDDLVTSVAVAHASGLRVLLAPRRPEMAELVAVEHVTKLVQQLRQLFDFVILDTSSCLSEINLTLLDQADRVLLIAEQSLPSLKTVRDFLDLSQGLDYGADKVMLVINRNEPKHRIGAKEIGNILKRPVRATIPIDAEAAASAADGGQPLVTGNTRRRPIGKALAEMAALVAGDLQATAEGTPTAQGEEGSFLGRLFGKG
jgi:pilus assembly protein CpaE